MTRNDAYSERAHSTLNKMSKQPLSKHGDAAQTNAEERAVQLRVVQVQQTTTETCECAEDVCGRWTDDGGQISTTLTDGAPSVRHAITQFTGLTR